MDNLNNRTFYYVMFDCDFPHYEHLGKVYLHTHGKIKESLKSDHAKIPILASLNDAKLLAQKFTKEAIKSGTTGNKSFPIAGALIFEIEIGDSVKIKNEENASEKGSVNYRNLFGLFGDSELLTYKVKTPQNDGSVIESTRGLLTSQGLANSTIKRVFYGHKINVDKHIAFAILNNVTNLKKEDLRILNEAYENENGHYFNNSSGSSSKLPSTPEIVNALLTGNNLDNPNSPNSPNGPNDPDNSDAVQLGGDYEKYRQEKARYLRLKKIAEQKGLNQTQQGGGDSNSNDYEKYRQEKERYLQLKKIAEQKGLNQKGLGQKDDSYEKYKEEKAKYLQLKKIAKNRGLI